MAGMASDFQNQINAAAANDARERVTVYLDDWRRLKSERAELLAALEEWVRQVDDAAQGDASVARALLARIRG